MKLCLHWRFVFSFIEKWKVCYHIFCDSFSIWFLHSWFLYFIVLVLIFIFRFCFYISSYHRITFIYKQLQTTNKKNIKQTKSNSTKCKNGTKKNGSIYLWHKNQFLFYLSLWLWQEATNRPNTLSFTTKRLLLIIFLFLFVLFKSQRAIAICLLCKATEKTVFVLSIRSSFSSLLFWCHFCCCILFFFQFSLSIFFSLCVCLCLFRIHFIQLKKRKN